MVKAYTLKIQDLPRALSFSLLFLSVFYCPFLWASQEAMVLVDRAVIYSDQEMTSPIGYISRGKKVKVGEIPRNKAQVYPIIVSGKVAYIRVLDVTTEKESMDSTRLTAERFQKTAEPPFSSRISLAYLGYSSTVSMDKENVSIKDQDSLFWNGVTLRGDVLFKSRWDVEIISNFLTTEKGRETINMVEFGVGGGLRIIDADRFKVRLEGQLLSIPFSTYSIGSSQRLKSFGYSAGGGMNIAMILGEHWGLDLFGGVFYTKLLGFDPPAPYNDISPSFTGMRGGAGFTWKY